MRRLAARHGVPVATLALALAVAGILGASLSGCRAVGRALRLTIVLGPVDVPSHVSVIVEEIDGERRETSRFDIEGSRLFEGKPDDRVVLIIPHDDVTIVGVGVFAHYDDNDKPGAVWHEGCAVFPLLDDEVTEGTVNLDGDPVPLGRAPFNGEVFPSGAVPALRWTGGACELTTYDVVVTDACNRTDFAGCAVPAPPATTSDTELIPEISGDVRWFWRVRGCHATATPTTCTDWSAWRYFDIGPTTSDFDGDFYADLVVGAAGTDLTNDDEGQVYVLTGGGSPVPWPVFSTINRAGALPGADTFFGAAVARVGDADGDGAGDLVIGAPGMGGNAYFLTGALITPDVGPAALVEIDNPYLAPITGTFGANVAAAGDVNADGFADFLVGDPLFGGGPSPGRAYLVMGAAAMTGATVVQIPAPATVPDRGFFGAALGSAGDTNGDGFADIVIGAPVDPTMPAPLPSAFLFYGAGEIGTTVLVLDEFLELGPAGAGTHFGAAVTSAGDLDGDGLWDIIVGQPGFEGTTMRNVGRLALYLTGPQGSVPAKPTALLGPPGDPTGNPRFGDNVIGVGDLNGDGVSEVLVGAPGWEVMTVPYGGAFVYDGAALGGPLADTTMPAHTLPSPGGAGESFGGGIGHALASPGPLCGDDALPDIAIGAFAHAGGVGTVWLFCTEDVADSWLSAGNVNQLGGPPLGPVLEADNLPGDFGSRFAVIR